ncbi:MAG: patatin-like phospholipase family protein [bacterium]|nr:patatin-like phospholipase family protein [bacterium]
MRAKNRKIGLALSGGAVLGIAHLGAIKVLEENNIRFNAIAGTSAGSLVGAFLAAGYNSDQLFQMARSLSWDDIGKITLPKMGLLNSKSLEEFIDEELGRIDIQSLPISFAAVGVDLTSGAQVVFKDGPVSEAVRVSCAIPGIFTPVVRGNQVLVDGGVLNVLPTDVVRDMGADYIISIKLRPSISLGKPPNNIVQVLINSFMLAWGQIAEHAPTGNITIVPNLSGLNPHDFDQAEELYLQGRLAALKSIKQIKKDLQPGGVIKKIFNLLKPNQ